MKEKMTMANEVTTAPEAVEAAFHHYKSVIEEYGLHWPGHHLVLEKGSEYRDWAIYEVRTGSGSWRFPRVGVSQLGSTNAAATFALSARTAAVEGTVKALQENNEEGGAEE